MLASMAEPATETESPEDVLDRAAIEPAALAPDGSLKGLAIRNPGLFSMRGVREIFVQAFTPDSQALPNAIDAIDWCQRYCEDPNTAVIVAVEGLEPDFVFRGLAILDWSPGVWTLAPQCLHFHSTGSDSLRVLTAAVAAWLREIGKNELVGLNFTGATDAAHGRMFSSHFTSEREASLLLMRLKEGPG